MRVRTVALEEFRSYERVRLDLAPGITAFVGPNGTGKTNLLEAIHVAARGDSPRGREDAELVRWGAALSRICVEIERCPTPGPPQGGMTEARRVEVVLFSPAPGERRRARRYLVNGAGKRAEDAMGELVVVAFFPEEVELLTDAPAARRRYLDAMLAQVDRAHRVDIREYARVLGQRNALLRSFARGSADGAVAEPAPAQELAFWDAELCRLAAVISLRRLRLVRELQPAFDRAVARFTGGAGLDMSYAAQCPGDTAEERRDGYRRLIVEKRERELWQATTLVGPHREDLVVMGGARPLVAFASRGEQRSAVLSLKLAEAEWLRQRIGESPVFLLDDVLSELDPSRRDALVAAIPPDAQALLTASLPAGLQPALLERATLVPLPIALASA